LILFFQLNILDITLLILKMKKKYAVFFTDFFLYLKMYVRHCLKKAILGWIYAVDRLNNRCAFLKYILKFLICVEFLNMLVSGVLLHITINISPVNDFFTGLFMFFFLINFEIFLHIDVATYWISIPFIFKINQITYPDFFICCRAKSKDQNM
jgi:hypothetical protein